MDNQEIYNWIEEVDYEKNNRLAFVYQALRNAVEQKIEYHKTQLNIAQKCLEQSIPGSAQQQEQDTEPQEVLVDYATYKKVADELQITAKTATRIFHSLQLKDNNDCTRAAKGKVLSQNKEAKPSSGSYLPYYQKNDKFFNEQNLLSITEIKKKLNNNSLRLYRVGPDSMEALRAIVNHLIESS